MKKAKKILKILTEIKTILEKPVSKTENGISILWDSIPSFSHTQESSHDYNVDSISASVAKTSPDPSEPKKRASFPELPKSKNPYRLMPLSMSSNEFAEAIIEWFLNGNLPTPDSLRSAKRSALLTIKLLFNLENDNKEYYLHLKTTLENFCTIENLFEHEKTA
jgi:hypothetical protein